MIYKKVVLLFLVMVVMSFGALAVNLELECSPSSIVVGSTTSCDLSFTSSTSYVAVSGELIVPNTLTDVTVTSAAGLSATYNKGKFSIDDFNSLVGATGIKIGTFTFTGAANGVNPVQITNAEVVNSNIAVVPMNGNVNSNDVTVGAITPPSEDPQPVVCGETPEGLNRQDNVLCDTGYVCYNNECILDISPLVKVGLDLGSLGTILNSCLSKNAGYAFLPSMPGGESQFLCLESNSVSSAECKAGNEGLVKAIGTVDFLCNKKPSGTFKWIECNALGSTINTNTNAAGNNVIWNNKNLCTSYQGGERWLICGSVVAGSDGISLTSHADFNCKNGVWEKAPVIIPPVGGDVVVGNDPGTLGPGDTTLPAGQEIVPGTSDNVVNPPFEPTGSACDGTTQGILSAIQSELTKLGDGAGKLAKLGAIAKAVRSCF